MTRRPAKSGVPKLDEDVGATAPELAGYRERALLVSTVRRLLAAPSTDTITVQQILDAASLYTRAFYRHFNSKEDLIAAVLHSDARRTERRLLSAMSAPGSHDAALVAWIDFWLELAFSAAHLNRVRAVIVGDPQVAEPFRTVTIEVKRTSCAVLALTIEGGLQQGVFGRGMPFEDAQAFQAIVGGIIDRRVHREPVPGRTTVRASLVGLMSRVLDADLDVAAQR